MHIHLGLKHKRQREERTLLSASALPNTSAPPKSRYFVLLDRVTLVAGIIGPFTVIPQIYEIFSTHQAGGVSSISWMLMSIETLPWIFYGIAHKDKAIIVSFILWEMVNLTVFAGAVIY